MKDFRYCVWWCPSTPCSWQSHVDFPVHVSLATEIDSEEEAERVAAEWRDKLKRPCRVSISGPMRITRDEGFYAVVYPVSPAIVEDAHVSIRYSYTNVLDLLVNLRPPDASCAEFCDIRVVRCTGHYKTWGRHSKL